MNLEEYKVFLKKLIVEDESAVLSNLQESLKQNSNAFDELIILQSGFNLYKRKLITGQLSSEEENTSRARIMAGLLAFINELNSDDLINIDWLGKSRFDPLPVHEGSSSTEQRIEKFHEKQYWDRLEKIGNWSFDSNEKIFLGKGVYQYLLSEMQYGENDFTILISIQFDHYKKFADNVLDNANAGIILGWLRNEEGRRYFNLLFTGEKILIEGIGLHSGDDYNDFIYFDDGVDFQIQDGQEYSIAIRVDQRKVAVFIDDEFTYSFQRPNGFIGKVGLRPWRSRIRCNFFEIREV